jgi:DNA ligase-1
MRPFAELLDRLLYTPQRNVKLALILDYLRSVPDPDRGWALAALTGGLAFRNAKPGLVRELAMSRTDPLLFAWSYDFVGDLAETTALLWPERQGNRSWPRLAEVIGTLGTAAKADLPGIIAAWLDTLDANGRWALLKLVTGGLRVGVSARLAKLALARYGQKDPAEIEEVWHEVGPPYAELFAWLDGRGPRPALEEAPVFRPLMLATPLEDEEIKKLDLDAYAAEWKWDGIRVQLVATARGVRLYSRTGDDIGPAFPEILEAVSFLAVLDGELLVGRAGGQAVDVASFNHLQQRLNRKTPTARLLETHPAFVRLYDMLFEGPEDLRPLPFLERRRRLEAFWQRTLPPRTDLSPLIPSMPIEALDALRKGARGTPTEGLMLKRKDSAFVAGRPKGTWLIWKRDPHTLDVVLMYAQRGHGKRSSFYSDYTFGAWRPRAEDPGAEELVPVGKAYFGFTDEELRALDRWVRDHTLNRFGPVREVLPGLVLEVAFDSVHRSTRHKSGVAMRFPRVHRIRWDKPAGEADRLEALERLID